MIAVPFYWADLRERYYDGTNFFVEGNAFPSIKKNFPYVR